MALTTRLLQRSWARRQSLSCSWRIARRAWRRWCRRAMRCCWPWPVMVSPAWPLRCSTDSSRLAWLCSQAPSLTVCTTWCSVVHRHRRCCCIELPQAPATSACMPLPHPCFHAAVMTTTKSNLQVCPAPRVRYGRPCCRAAPALWSCVCVCVCVVCVCWSPVHRQPARLRRTMPIKHATELVVTPMCYS